MKLDEINKKNVFKVPDRYFSELPGRIQGRIPSSATSSNPYFSWRLALGIVPALAILLITLYLGFLHEPRTQDPAKILAMVSTDDVIAYLELSDITTDEIIEGFGDETLDLDIDLEDEFLPDDSEMEKDELDDLIRELELQTEFL